MLRAPITFSCTWMPAIVATPTILRVACVSTDWTVKGTASHHADNATSQACETTTLGTRELWKGALHRWYDTHKSTYALDAHEDPLLNHELSPQFAPDHRPSVTRRLIKTLGTPVQPHQLASASFTVCGEAVARALACEGYSRECVVAAAVA